MKILLDYVFPITVIESIAAASTGFLKQVCLVAKPKAGQEANVGQIFECADMTAVAVRTANTEAQQLFNAGMAKVYILLSDDLDLETVLDDNANLFYTLLISSQFIDADVTAITLGTFEGVVGVSSANNGFLTTQAAIAHRVAFFRDDANGAKNMCYAFGKLLSNATNWLNQQYITMPFDDGVDTLGDALSLFDDKVSFVIADSEFGTRLGLFSAGGKAIVAPYILKNLRVDLQSRSLSWIAANQPSYTKKEATLLETRLQEDVINDYVGNKHWVDGGTVVITLGTSGFVASGAINVAEPKALWRIPSELTQTL